VADTQCPGNELRLDESGIIGLPAQRGDAPGITVRVRGIRRRRDARGEDVCRNVAQAAQCDRAAIIPERVERIAHLRCGRAGDEDVAVAIVELVVPVVVAVLVVASAGNADRIVDQQQLVVHALVHLQEAAQDAGGELERWRARLVERRVVDAQLEVRVRARQRGVEGRSASENSWSTMIRTSTPRRAALTSSSMIR
jgi:hypothetical protein